MFRDLQRSCTTVGSVSDPTFRSEVVVELSGRHLYSSTEKLRSGQSPPWTRTDLEEEEDVRVEKFADHVSKSALYLLEIVWLIDIEEKKNEYHVFTTKSKITTRSTPSNV